MITPVLTRYLEQLEAAVLAAEWWMADPQVAQRKDPRGERKAEVFKAADLVRQRQIEVTDK
jgi:hypothetical protein